MGKSDLKKVCTKCHCEKPLSDFSFRYKEKGKYHPWCRPCTRQHNMNRYYAKHEYYRKHHTELTEKKRRYKTKKVLEYLLGCVDKRLLAPLGARYL
jgi:molecular chaperone GrpE (heat shock protein)